MLAEVMGYSARNVQPMSGHERSKANVIVLIDLDQKRMVLEMLRAQALSAFVEYVTYEIDACEKRKKTYPS